MSDTGKKNGWQGGCVAIVCVTFLAVFLAFVGGVGLLTFIGTLFDRGT